MKKPFSEYEESDFFSDRKDSKKERKLIQKLDRSKYKKTDRDKVKTTRGVSLENLKNGRVIKILGQGIIVESGDKEFTCTIRGALKKEKQQLKTLVIVGDVVYFDDEGSIQAIEPRHTVLSRADHLSQQKEHLIAANVDQVFIVVSVLDPPLRSTIIDRYLIAAEQGNMTPLIVCNKIDLLTSSQYTKEERDHEVALLDECQKIYEDIGFPFLKISCITLEGIPELQKHMKNHISVFSGQSGSGKSSIINAATNLELKVGKTVLSSRKGAHTTTTAELLHLPFGGYVVDTPGIKSFGMWNVPKESLRNLFPEFLHLPEPCKYADCYHRGEEGCAVPDAIDNGLVSKLRYDSYLNILQSLESEHFRR